ncbi:16S rRNA (guanine(527)-N(7))-methyltransferase RsmG [Undibacterium luofuense]|uniref:Ribosomal RNA small subunit methyltransferase G n=1 Tax=Undibacterium luofuense TaxID=2828733 RepID=A0A941DP31_9BURK|nr:16S rRNA (guanine(527)-N(7))-methyltransferase RsmG [Undibacterium luofuense]MBR7783450.1 16S rRNA (guanine(527)-N(7))-methyltransferase RsmG [Undibacterium luofuense]
MTTNHIENLRPMLESGLDALCIKLTKEQQDKIINYLIILSKWNSVYNLTAIRDPKEMMTHHVLDSLSAVPAFTEAQNVLDVGSGGGLPGMILAICYPDKKISMIDTVSKKTAFLNQAKAELGLNNVTVYSARVESLQVNQPFDVITSRAFSELNNFVNWSQHLLAEGGRFIAMKGVHPQGEMERLPEGWEVKEVRPLTVPGLDAERHLIFIQKTAA